MSTPGQPPRQPGNNPPFPRRTHVCRASLEKFIERVKEASIRYSRENRRARVNRADLYKALWDESGETMPKDRLKKISSGRKVVVTAYVRQRREQREIRQQLLAVAAAAQRQAQENAALLAVPEPDDQNMETDRSSHSEAPRSSNSVDMRSVGSHCPSTSSASTSSPGTKAAARREKSVSKSCDEMSVDTSGEKAKSGDSMSVEEVLVKEEEKDGGESVVDEKADETLYDVSEPTDSDSSDSKSGVKQEDSSAGTTEEVSSKYSLDGAESLPDDEAEPKASEEWVMELRDEDSVDQPVELKLAEEDPVEEPKEDLMDVIVGKFSEAGLKSKKRGSPGKATDDSPRKAKELRKSCDAIFEQPQKAIARRTFPTVHRMAPQTPPRQRSVSESEAADRPRPKVDEGSPSLRRSSPRVSGPRPSPKKRTVEVTSPSIVISPPDDEEDEDL